MRFTRGTWPTVAVAAAAALALTLTGCTTSGAPGDSASANYISYAHEQEFGAYNNNTAEANAVANAVVMNQVLPYFSYVDPTGVVQRNEEFGTFEKVSDSPLTVEYTIAEEAVWSDGTPITARDWYLTYAASSGKYEGFTPVSTSGIEMIQTPTEDGDSKTFTVVYDGPFGDWETALGTQSEAFLPAHVVERETGVDIVEAVRGNDTEALRKAGEFWDTQWSGFAPGSLPDQSLIPSGGPYKIGEWRAGQSITLVPNEAYWGTKPKNDGIVIRFIAQEAQVQALENGDADVIEPQPNVDVIAQIQRLGDRVTVLTGPQYTYDHVDMNLEGTFANKDLREALAYCLPRQEIVDKLITPVDPGAKLLEASTVLNFEPAYDAVVAASGAGKYAARNLEAARAAVERSGVSDLKIDAVYLGNPNQRRQNTMDLIAASCGQVGFEFTVRALTPTEWGPAMTDGNFDLAQFAWAGSGLTAPVQPLYRTGSDQNYSKYSNPQVDALLAQLVETGDVAEQDRLFGEIEKLLWTDLPTVPLFAWPQLVAHNSDITGVVRNTTQTQASFNASEWERVS